MKYKLSLILELFGWFEIYKNIYYLLIAWQYANFLNMGLGMGLEIGMGLSLNFTQDWDKAWVWALGWP